MSFTKLAPAIGLLATVTTPAALAADVSEAKEQLTCVKACLDMGTKTPASLVTPSPLSNELLATESLPPRSLQRLAINGSATSFDSEQLDSATGGFAINLFSAFNQRFYTEFELITETGTIDAGQSGKVGFDHLNVKGELGATAHKWNMDFGVGLAYTERHVNVEVPNDASITDTDKGISLNIWTVAYLGDFGVQLGAEVNNALGSVGMRTKLFTPAFYGFRGLVEARFYDEQINAQAGISYQY